MSDNHVHRDQPLRFVFAGIKDGHMLNCDIREGNAIPYRILYKDKNNTLEFHSTAYLEPKSLFAVIHLDYPVKVSLPNGLSKPLRPAVNVFDWIREYVHPSDDRTKYDQIFPHSESPHLTGYQQTPHRRANV
jgi:hypothetical protein